jgi:hypothetical protein
VPRESSASASNGGKERDERSHSLSRPLIVTIVKMAASSGAKAGFSTPTRRACLGDPPQKVEPIAIMVHDPTGNFAVLAMI